MGPNYFSTLVRRLFLQIEINWKLATYDVSTIDTPAGDVLGAMLYKFF